MTLAQFIEALEQTPREWQLVHGHALRLRLNDFAVACPLSSLRHESLDYWERAAIDLELNADEATAIAYASDDDPDYPCDRALRARLLKACGLQ